MERRIFLKTRYNISFMIKHIRLPAFLFVFFIFASCAAPKPAGEQTVIPPVITESGAIPIMDSADASITETLPVQPGHLIVPDEIIRRDFPHFVFIPEPVPYPETAPGVGNITADRRDFVFTLNNNERIALSGVFRDAYTDGLLRNQPFIGVLGGDQVHGWPQANPVSWVQNWQTSMPMANSWGLPSLVLSIAGRDSGDFQRRAFTVQGDILDYYGRGSGLNGANGNTGFGSPRGEEFLYEEKIAQRFDHGLMVINENRKVEFIAETPPSEIYEIPEMLGFFPGSPDIQKIFITAWKIALDCNMENYSEYEPPIYYIPVEILSDNDLSFTNDESDDISDKNSVDNSEENPDVNMEKKPGAVLAVIPQKLLPDSPVQYVRFTGEKTHLFPDTDITGIYIQTFNQNTSALVLLETASPDASRQPVLPQHARFLCPLMFEMLTTGTPLPGTETLELLNFYSGVQDKFLAGLLQSFALYGFPLTDPVFRSENGFLISAEQRFTRGWIRFTGLR